jgi:transcriptional regulator with GAF, ATPase, and Fis domain
MIREAFERAVLAEVGDGERSTLSLAQVCAACSVITLLRVSIVLMTQGNQQAAMAASDGATLVEDLQFTLGEGPGVDAYSEGRPVLVTDLAGAASRWMHFVPTAMALGVGAVFAFPMRLGAISTGVLSLYADQVRTLDDGQLEDLVTLADLVTRVVLAMQTGVTAEELAGSLATAADHRAVVHQATGMVAVQLGSSVQDAFVRLRARAYADGLGIDELSTQVVDRRIRFEP